MKVLFVWSGLTGYMGDCWRELAGRPDVELKIAVDTQEKVFGGAFKADEVLRGLDWSVELPRNWCPDIVFTVGWHNKLCRDAALNPGWDSVPKVCCFDMPWRWQLRCIAAKFVLWHYLRHFAAAYVPGLVCERYCRWIGFRKVRKGLFSLDQSRFTRGETAYRLKADAPFLYLGRYATEKRLDVLLTGYRKYRAMGGTRELHLYGKGGALPKGTAETVGVRVNEFVSPQEVPGLMREAAAMVLSSDFDPWPLVLLEAMSAGCRIIASDRCTNWPELGAVWGMYKAGDATALAKQMLGVENLRIAGREVIAPYDCTAWRARTLELAKEVCGD